MTVEIQSASIPADANQDLTASKITFCDFLSQGGVDWAFCLCGVVGGNPFKFTVRRAQKYSQEAWARLADGCGLKFGFGSASVGEGVIWLNSPVMKASALAPEDGRARDVILWVHRDARAVEMQRVAIPLALLAAPLRSAVSAAGAKMPFAPGQ